MLSKLRNAELLRQIILFGIVGVCATLTHYLVAMAAVTYASVAIYIANLLGYLTAMSVSLFGHSRLSFRMAVTKPVVSKFIVVSIGTFIASEIILYVLETRLALDHHLSLGVVVVTIPVISFILNKFWVFSPKSHIVP